MTSSPEKEPLRQKHIAKRAALSPTDHARMSKACCNLICEAVRARAKKPLVVAGYAPIKGEIDIMGALADLALGNHVTVLPSVEKDALTFRHWKPGEPLQSGVLGTRVPHALAAQDIPDIVIVPLVAFDRRGMRLGYGWGYYDGALQQLRTQNPFLFALGAGFSMQEESALPSEVHDERLDMIITEKEIIPVL